MKYWRFLVWEMVCSSWHLYPNGVWIRPSANWTVVRLASVVDIIVVAAQITTIIRELLLNTITKSSSWWDRRSDACRCADWWCVEYRRARHGPSCWAFIRDWRVAWKPLKCSTTRTMRAKSGRFAISIIQAIRTRIRRWSACEPLLVWEHIWLSTGPQSSASGRNVRTHSGSQFRIFHLKLLKFCHFRRLWKFSIY